MQLNRGDLSENTHTRDKVRNKAISQLPLTHLLPIVPTGMQGSISQLSACANVSSGTLNVHAGNVECLYLEHNFSDQVFGLNYQPLFSSSWREYACLNSADERNYFWINAPDRVDCSHLQLYLCGEKQKVACKSNPALCFTHWKKTVCKTKLGHWFPQQFFLLTNHISPNISKKATHWCILCV